MNYKIVQLDDGLGRQIIDVNSVTKGCILKNFPWIKKGDLVKIIPGPHPYYTTTFWNSVHNVEASRHLLWRVITDPDHDFEVLLKPIGNDKHDSKWYNIAWLELYSSKADNLLLLL